MNKEIRNHYLKLLGVFAFMFLLGTIYNEIFNNSESPTNSKKKNKENVDGGPCSYKYDSIPIVILEIIPESEGVSDLLLHECFYSGNDSTICDTLFYSNTMNRKIENSEIEKLNLKKGDSITLFIGNISSGHCNPLHNIIKLNKYKNQ